MDEVERVVEEVVPPVFRERPLQPFQRCRTPTVLHRNLAVKHGRIAVERRNGRDQRLVTLRPVEALARLEPDLVALLPDDRAVAVELDLVEPVRPLWRGIHRGGELGGHLLRKRSGLARFCGGGGAFVAGRFNLETLDHGRVALLDEKPGFFLIGELFQHPAATEFLAGQAKLHLAFFERCLGVIKRHPRARVIDCDGACAVRVLRHRTLEREVGDRMILRPDGEASDLGIEARPIGNGP